jgi:predicted nucleic acid-binding protein
MSSGERRYALDTNVFVRATRDPVWNDQLARFHAAFAPFEVLAAVVVQELLAGARGTSAKVLERSVLEPFVRRGRLIVPSYAAWKETGSLLSTLVGTRTARWTDVSRSFVNDILLAMSCREAGIVLVTENVRDFERIAELRAFDFVPPWPVPSG